MGFDDESVHFSSNLCLWRDSALSRYAVTRRRSADIAKIHLWMLRLELLQHLDLFHLITRRLAQRLLLIIKLQKGQ